jgi:hypothetical protein
LPDSIDAQLEDLLPVFQTLLKTDKG